MTFCGRQTFCDACRYTVLKENKATDLWGFYAFLATLNPGLKFSAIKFDLFMFIIIKSDLISTLYLMLYYGNVSHVILQYLVYDYEKLNI